jgi:site-specific DNA-methyltransferase (cytosine-N4-specific)
VGSQFTPRLVDLAGFVQAIVAKSGDQQAMATAVWQPGVRIAPKTGQVTKRVRNLPLEAAIQYGLLSKSYEATDLARMLATLKPAALYQAFGRHILLELGGLRVTQGIDEMIRAGQVVTGDSLARYLTQQGFNVGEHNTQINSMRLWLAEAGLFAKGVRTSSAWTINRAALRQLVGLSEEAVGILAGLEDHQRAFVEALCAIGDRKNYKAAEVRALAETRSPHVRFNRGSLPLDILEPLRAAGLISYRTGGTRGGKSAILTLTKNFRRDVLQTFVTRTASTLDPVVSGYFKKSPADIKADLASSDTGKKGRALEALAIRLMRLLGLRFLQWNTRATPTAWAEVDAAFAGVFGAVPTRWQIQCKSTRSPVRLEDVAKEVGLTPVTCATHILFLANSTYTADARKYAEQVMARSALAIYLLERSDFDQLMRDDSSLGRILREKAEAAVWAIPADSIFAWRKKLR